MNLSSTNNSLLVLNQKHQQNNSTPKSENQTLHQLSNRNSGNFPKFDIRDYLDRLDLVRETLSEYHCKCPKCGDGGFKIDKKTGKYNPFKCGCDLKDIRECIRPWNEVEKSNNREQKSIRPPKYRKWVYRDRQENFLVKVCRRDDGKGGKPKRWQEHWNGQEWVKGYGNVKQKDIPIYRYREIREAIANGETIFVVEGEPCADILWEIGIPATTNIGGAGKWLKTHTEDLAGAKLIVLSPDRDEPGVKHMEEIASGISGVKWLYPLPDSPLWNKELPANNGVDIFDWIAGDKVTKENILNSIEDRPRNLKLSKDNQNNNNILQYPDSKIEPEDKTIPLDELLLEEIDSLVAGNFSQAELEAKIIALARDFSRGTQEIWKLYHSRAEELEQTENRETTKEEVNRLLKIQNYQLELENYLPPTLAKPLKKLAVYLGVNNATLLTILLTTCASLIPIDTKLELIKATSFYARSILYAGICAPSGSGKSPAFKAILQPLFKLQEEEDCRYNLELEDYKQQLQQYKRNQKNPEVEEPEPPPPPREYFVTDCTSEAIANIQNNQPDRGFLGYFDEFKQLIGQSNSYRGGRGADIEKLLSGRDGSGFKTNRASGKRISCPRSGYSILGGIQPNVLRQQMGDFSDDNGFWARFIWVNQPMQRKPFPDDEITIDISPLLRSLYEFLGTIDNTFVLSQGAKEKYREWYNFVESQKLQEVKPALQAVWSKSQRLVGELALLIHCLTYAVAGEQPPQEVAPEILSKAISLAKFYLGQIKLIHADGGAEDNSLPNIYTKLIELSKRKGWLTARDVKASIRNYRNKTPNQVRSLFREIEALGYGITRGTGSKLQWNYQTVDNVDIADNSVDTMSTIKKNLVTLANSSSNHNTNQKLLTTVDKEKSPVNTATQSLQPKTVDNVDSSTQLEYIQESSPPIEGRAETHALTFSPSNLVPLTEKTQFHPERTVDNKINTPVNKLSTENLSSSCSGKERACQQSVNSSSTENRSPQSNQAVDESSTISSVSTINSPDQIEPSKGVSEKSEGVDEVLSTEDWLHSSECIDDFAGMLLTIDSAAGLAELLSQEGFTRALFELALAQLRRDQQQHDQLQRLRQWGMALQQHD